MLYSMSTAWIPIAASATVQDVVVTLSNPAYEEVKKIQIQLQENSAYGVAFYHNPNVW